MSLAFRYISLRERILARHRLAEVYRAEDGSDAEMDRTGRVVEKAEIIPAVLDTGRRVAFSYNPKMVPYSYWRSQELSLFWRAKSEFRAPVLDFGCGDGSFTRGLFEHIEYGVDIDPSALEIAAQYGLYDRLLTFDKMASDLPDASVGTVFSCSVLEHTVDVKTCLEQIARVLKPGGRLYFTVPSPGLTEHMSILHNRTFADMMNKSMFHRNMLEAGEWRGLITSTGLKICQFQEFQPLSFTRKFFLISLLGNRSFGRIPGFRSWFWRRYREKLMEDVAKSISGQVERGANYFVIAERIG